MYIYHVISFLQETVVSNFPLFLINITSKNDILPLCSTSYKCWYFHEIYSKY